MKSKAKIHKIYSFLLKTLIIIASYGFIYKQILYKRGIKETFSGVESLFDSHLFNLLLYLVILLMLLNWGTESYKWKFLISKIEKISFFKAFKAVLAGVTVSTFTPGRTGEFIGRVFVLEKANPWEGTFATITGSISQFIITVTAGLISVLIFIFKYVEFQGYFNIYTYSGIFILVIAVIIILIILYFNISILATLFERFRFFNKYEKLKSHLHVFSIYSAKELFGILVLSFIRYCIFSLQYYLLLNMFGVKIPFFEAFFLISLTFFAMSVIPTIALSELGVRGSVALYFIGCFFIKHGLLNEQVNIGILASSTLLWAINLAIPALAGGFFIISLKFFRNKN